MNTQTIIMPNQDSLLKTAVEKHKELPWSVAPDFYPKCCKTTPLIKKGPAMISTIKCPVCGCEYGVWSLSNTSLINGWCEEHGFVYHVRMNGPVGPFGPLEKMGLISIWVSKDVWVREWEDVRHNKMYGVQIQKLDRKGKNVSVCYRDREVFVLTSDRRKPKSLPFSYIDGERGYPPHDWPELRFEIRNDWELEPVRDLVEKLANSIRDD